MVKYTEIILRLSGDAGLKELMLKSIYIPLTSVQMRDNLIFLKVTSQLQISWKCSKFKLIIFQTKTVMHDFVQIKIKLSEIAKLNLPFKMSKYTHNMYNMNKTGEQGKVIVEPQFL